MPGSAGASVSTAAGDVGNNGIPGGLPLPPSSDMLGPEANVLQLEVGTCSLKGLKRCNPGWVNQDMYLVVPISASLYLAAVFDGHGEHGHHVSDRVKELFEQYAHTLIVQRKTPLREALKQIFAISQDILEREGMSQLSGTTVTVAIIDQVASLMVTAHVGDSKLMVVRGSQTVFETLDHVIDDEEDRRVTACGGEVRELDGIANAGVRRIFTPGQHLPGLAMARSLGDMEAHSLGALAEPSISDVPLKAGSTIIVASDGVWDKLPKEFVSSNVALVRAESSAHAMAFAARARWPAEGDIDDITAVVVQVRAAESDVKATKAPSEQMPIRHEV
jgi:serine/threonine protein phosphatase PrpC